MSFFILGDERTLRMGGKQRKALKDLGAVWNKEMKRYDVPEENFEAACKLVESLPEPKPKKHKLSDDVEAAYRLLDSCKTALDAAESLAHRVFVETVNIAAYDTHRRLVRTASPGSLYAIHPPQIPNFRYEDLVFPRIHGCAESPVGFCAYSSDDVNRDQCLFCNDPEERK